MREDPRETRVEVDLYERLDAMPMSELERVRAKARLARAEHVAELVVRAAGAASKLVRAVFLRPIRRARAPATSEC